MLLARGVPRILRGGMHIFEILSLIRIRLRIRVKSMRMHSPVPRFIKRSFSFWKQAETAHFWKRAFRKRDKLWSETWVVFSSFSAGIKPHQTKMLVLEENMKTTSSDCFQLKRANWESKLICKIAFLYHICIGMDLTKFLRRTRQKMVVHFFIIVYISISPLLCMSSLGKNVSRLLSL